MSVDLRCICGLTWTVKAIPRLDNRFCPQCGRRFDIPSEIEDNSPPARGDRSQGSRSIEAVETVALSPLYQPAPSKPINAEELAYQLVEVPSENKSPTRYSEEEDRALRRLLSNAKREIRRRSQIDERYFWPLEMSWMQCLFYPLRVAGGNMCLAIVWATLTPIVMATVPSPAAGFADWIVRLPLLVYPVVILGITWCYLRSMLGAARVGDRGPAPWPFHKDFRAMVKHGITAIVSFLAGPIALVAAAIWFWVHAGTLTTTDTLILWQLTVCAAVLWIYLLLAADANDRLYDVHSEAVMRLIKTQGWPACVFPLLGGLSVGVFMVLAVETWILSFGQPGGAWLLHVILWYLGLCVWAFLLRVYGLNLYWRAKGEVGRELETA